MKKPVTLSAAALNGSTRRLRVEAQAGFVVVCPTLMDRPHIAFIRFGAEPDARHTIFIVKPQDWHVIAPEPQFATNPPIFIHNLKFFGSDDFRFLRRFFREYRSPQQELI